MARQDWFGLGNPNPFGEIHRLQDEINRVFAASHGGRPAAEPGRFPAINGFAGEDGVVLTAELPGVHSEDLDISVVRDTVTLRGRRRPPPDAKGYHRQERRQGEFGRTITLPFPVDPNRVDARMDNGVLYLVLHRPEAEKPRRIQVNAGEGERTNG